MDKAYITVDMIRELSLDFKIVNAIKSEKAIRFKSNEPESIAIAQMLGDTLQLDDNIIALVINNDITIISDKQLAFPKDSSWMYEQ